jgi:hypothetical protein
VKLTASRAQRKTNAHETERGKVCRVYEFIKANRSQYDVKMICRVHGGYSQRLLRLAA